MLHSQFVTRFGLSCLLSTSAAALALTAATPVWAQSASAPSQRGFDIPALPLNEALRLFMQQSGIQISYASGEGANVRTSPVQGDLSPAAALSQLLAGTGLTYRFTAPTSAILEPAPIADSGAVQLGPVRVAADDQAAGGSQAEVGNLSPEYAGGQVATGGKVGLLGKRDVMDTPFSVTQYTSRLIEDQQSQNLGDVLVNDPSIRNTYARGSGRDEYNIRGFTLFNYDVAFNGLYGISPRNSTSLIGIERVEVLRGPNALLNGIAPFGSIGGSINLVPKRAGDDPLNRVTLSYVSDSQVAGHIDVARRVGADERLGIRINGIYSSGDTPVDGSKERLGSATLGLDYRGDNFRLEGDFTYQHRLTYGRSGLIFPPPSTVQIGPAPDANTNIFPPWTYWKQDEIAGVVRGELDLAPDWTVFGALGAKDHKFDTLQVNWLLQNTAGLIGGRPARLGQHIKNFTGEAGTRGKFETGGLTHELAVTGSFFNEDRGELRSATQPIIVSNLYAPANLPKPSVALASNRPKVGETRLRSAALADTISAFDRAVQLTAGLRYQHVEVSTYTTAASVLATRYEKSAITPTVALVVKPVRNLSLYGNFIQGLAQGPVAPVGATNAGEIFPPFKSKQFEFGAKYDLGTLSATLSFFQVQQPNGLLLPSGRFDVDGEQRNRGVEFLLSGEPVHGLRLLGGATFTDGDLTHTQGGVNDGKTAPAVPRTQVNLSGELDVPFVPGLTVTSRVVYTGSQYVDAANAQKLPDWTRWDLGARFRFNAGNVPITVRADVENVLGNDYWLSAARGGLSVRAPLTALLSVSLDL